MLGNTAQKSQELLSASKLPGQKRQNIPREVRGDTVFGMGGFCPFRCLIFRPLEDEKYRTILF